MTMIIPAGEPKPAGFIFDRCEARKHFTWAMLLSADGMHDLTVFLPDDVDFDDRFQATCAETGDLLDVNGWLYDVAD